MQGSLWTKGRAGMIGGAAIIAILIIRVPVVRWFLAIALVIGVVMVPLIRWWHDSHPVKDPDEDKIKLHLND
jgi:uncharacterized membrane protein YedE/YeeE